MTTTARSFSAICGLDILSQRLAEARRGLAPAPVPAGGLLFVSGLLAQRLPAVAELVREAWRGVPTCVAPAAGVLSERGEIEGEGAASGLLWQGGRATAFAAPGPALGVAVGRALAASRGSGAAVIFASHESFAEDDLEELRALAPGACVMGAGTVGAGPIAISASGELLDAPAAGLAITGLSPLVEASPACRLLTDFHAIEEATQGGLVLRAGGRAALDLLSDIAVQPGRRGGEAPGRGGPPEPAPVVLAALADPPGPQEEGEPRYLVRAVRGVDPSRRAVMIGEAARPGVRLAFAVRDAAAARAGLAAAARRVAGGALGAAPRFALFLSCAGRGQGLYGAPDVEARLLRERFPELPIVGMHSAFELVPWGPGAARLTLHTGVLALFRAPS